MTLYKLEDFDFVGWVIKTWPEIYFTFARGTADRNAGSRDDEAHASIEHFDREYCVLDLKIGRDGLKKNTKYINSRYPSLLIQGPWLAEEC